MTATGRGVPIEVILVGCSKRKLAAAVPARELYTSPLFQKGRAYAQAAGVPWFVLSAKHGLVSPSTIVEPYDLTLAATSREYRREWARRVLNELEEALGSLSGTSIEIHAGATYTASLRPLLESQGALVSEPLQGLRQGERLAWYRNEGAEPRRPGAGPEASEVAARLVSSAARRSPAEFLATSGEGLRLPGVYSWWVDADGAEDLSAGLGHPVAAGLIYAGLAGATRRRSGRRSSNTLWGRISGMHLGGRHEFSTFRLSLGSVLAASRRAGEIDEEALTDWMHAHLEVIAVPVADAGALDALESAILGLLDPPLNLSKMAASPVRARLTELRKLYSRKRRRSSPGSAARPAVSNSAPH